MVLIQRHHPGRLLFKGLVVTEKSVTRRQRGWGATGPPELFSASSLQPEFASFRNSRAGFVAYLYWAVRKSDLMQVPFVFVPRVGA